MKKSFFALLSVLTAMVLPSCFQSETTVRLNKDGSGTLVEDMRLGAQMLAMLDQMSALGGQMDAKNDPMATMFSAEKAKAHANDLGAGVVFEKSEAINANGAKGARVTYRFKDINTLKISPDHSMKNMSPMAAAKSGAQASSPITFAYEGGKLTIKMPERAQNTDRPESPIGDHPGAQDMDNPDSQAMMKEMLSDMTMKIQVVVEPGIVESNATYQSANTITLMDVNMGKLLAQPKAFKQLGKIDRHNPTAAMELLKGIEGAKFETQSQVNAKVK